MRENGERWRITNPGYAKRYDRCLSLVAKAVEEFFPGNQEPIDDE
jgi:nicotinamide riboside kinase